MKQEIIKLLKKETKLSEKELENLLEIPPNPSLGDYAFPCFALSKKLKKNPQEIAQQLAKKIKSSILEKVESKGPYVNFFLDKGLISESVIKINKDFGKIKGKREKIMTEFCHLNTHKDMHIGHTRNITLGESISRILEFSGNKVIRTNYQGDIGLHVAKALWGLQNLNRLGLKEPKEDKGKWLGVVYSAAGKAAEDKKIMEEINEVNRKLDLGDKKLTDLWKKSRKWSIDYFEKVIYPDFNANFDRFYFEGEVKEKGVEIAKKLLKDKKAKKSDGAIIMDLKKKGMGVFIILKKDGTSLYATRDLYLAILQDKEFKPDKIVHVVGSEHDLYFKQLFETISHYNKKLSEKQVHLSYALVLSPTGKLKSRDDHGKKILYDDTVRSLMEIAMKGIKSRNPKISKKELEKKARIISLGAIKYQMLSQSPNRTIVFDEKQVMKFEGNTGPYLLYTYARARSVLKKASSRKKTQATDLSESEAQLSKLLLSFPQVVEKSAKQLAPNLIANYAFDLSQKFNEFYHKEKVIGSENESFRISLVDATSMVLKNALGLLGIETLEQM